jgi:hypothetical protein
MIRRASTSPSPSTLEMVAVVIMAAAVMAAVAMAAVVMAAAVEDKYVM